MLRSVKVLLCAIRDELRNRRRVFNPTPASYPKNLNRHQNFEDTTTNMEAEHFSSEKREFPKKKCGA
jgi:hypothetical protein